jgi:hypothetical protein
VRVIEIKMSIDHWWNVKDQENPKLTKKNIGLSLRHFVQHKSELD